MKISLKWLNNYVSVDEFFEKPEELDRLLTSIGLEVEGVENTAEALKNTVVGHIVELGRHPDADKLTLCQVDVGDGEPKQIICGANNHKQGDKVVVALPGAVLPGDFAIKKSKIRGVESHGMLCSEVELGLGDHSEGIILLPKDAPVGTAFTEFAELNDIVYDISITPNRADCLSHIGVAREVAACLGKELKLPVVEFTKTKGKSSDLATVELVDSYKCPRYCGRGIMGVEVGPSPIWLKKAVESVGMNSINNIVDITNYVMLEFGQPLHAFDAGEIAGKKIIIDDSKPGETFTTLDGTELKLTGQELMIRDGERPVALAGIVGGLNSGVTEKTKNIFLEAAFFTTGAVRKTARKYKVDTESGFRFARGTNPDLVPHVMDRACQLIQQVAGGTVCEDFIDEYPKPIVRNAISISLSYVSERLGYKADGENFKAWMEKLGCSVTEPSKCEYKVQPPFFRWDLMDDVDLVEEYARLNGYDKIPEHFPSLEHSPTPHDLSYDQGQTVAELLKQEGYLQAINYNFVGDEYQRDLLKGSEKALEALGVPAPVEGVKILNPLSDETNVMRSALFCSLFKNLSHNIRHGNEFGRLFEVGYTFSKNESEYDQHQRLSLMAWGQKETLWQKEQERPAVFDVKSAFENVFKKLSVNSYQWRTLKPEQTPEFLHPGQCAGVFFEGNMIGYVGTLHPSLASENKIRVNVAVAEVDLPAIMRGQPRKPKLKELSKFPAVERDIAFLVPDSLAAADLIKEIQKAGGKLLQSVEVFDVYRGKGVEDGFSSTAFKMVYQDPAGTLGEEQLTKLQESVIAGLKKKFNVAVR